MYAYTFGRLHFYCLNSNSLVSRVRDPMELKPFNNNILEKWVRSIRACFVSYFFCADSISSTSLPASFLGDTQGNSYVFFAKIGSSMNRSPAAKKVEQYAVDRIKGDGRCLFRALVKGMAFNKGLLNHRRERDDAELRMAVKEVLCNDPKEREKYKEALVAITVDDYCQRIGRHDFWGGESELLVLSKLCKQPIIVYIPEQRGGFGSGFIPIAEYGSEFQGGWGKGKTNKNVVRLLYSG